MPTKRLLFYVFLFLTDCCVEPSFSQVENSQTPPVANQDQPADDQRVFAVDFAAAEKLQTGLRDNDREAVAQLIEYPLRREFPLKSIANKVEFKVHWAEYFDTANIKTLIDAQAEQYGWRGIALANGRVWFAHGHVASIFTETAAGKEALADARKREAQTLYASARGYDSIAFQCNTAMLQVRAQRHGKDLRYFAWKTGVALSSKPQLELRGGVYDPQGTGGNFNLSFNSKGYAYQLQVGHNLCGESCNDYLIVTKNKKVMSSRVCTDATN